MLAGMFLFLVNLAGAQILTNGEFELGVSSWNSSLSSGGAATFASTTANIHSGTNALLVTVSNAGTASNSVRIASTSFTASSSDTYVLRFWASASVVRANLGINLNGATPVYPQIPFQISTNANSYQEYLYAFRATGNVSIAFNFQTAGNYWLDDVAVLDLTNHDGWDIPMTYLWQWGQLEYSKTNSTGWGGGDNDKSVLLPDGSVAWIFNDSFASTLNSFYSNIRGNTSLPRNSVVHQVGTNLYWMNNGIATFFVPTNPASIYWIGDVLVESNKLLVLLSEINASPITRVGTAIGKLSLPGLTLDSITTVGSPGADDYNQVVNGNDGYDYIYWTTNTSGNRVRVARTPVGSLAVSAAWSYWNGSTWVTDHLQAAGLPNLISPWSFAQLGTSNYVAVYMPTLSWMIMAQFAPSPMGPWSVPVPVYNTPSEWGELNYMPNICAGTGSNGIYTIGYSDDNSPEGLNKWVSDKSYYNPHFITANLRQLSPYSLTSGSGGPGSRLAIKFAADKDYGNNAINNYWGAGVLNTTNWFNFFGPNGASSGVTNAIFYSRNGSKYASGTKLVYNWANELNSINNNVPLTNNVALMDGFINVNNNCWYLSVTNLDASFTNGYSVYFYYNGGAVGRGGQDFIRYYAGQTTNSAVLGTKQWNLYTTVTANDGQFTQDLTPFNAGTSGETSGANYIVFTNLSGGAFDLLITNGNYGGVNAIEIVANPAATTTALNASTNSFRYGTTVTLTSGVSPAPPDGENVAFMDGGTVLGAGTLSNGIASYHTSSLAVGTHAITAGYGGDGNYLASTSGVLTLTVIASPTISAPAALPATNVYVGMNVTLVCSNYSGTPPYSFQWQSSVEGIVYANVNGAATNQLILYNATTNHSGYYQLIFTASGQSVTSPVVQLKVNLLPVLAFLTSGGSLILTWLQGSLLQASNLMGPWTANNATSPYTNQPSYTQMFYRVRVE